MKEGIHINPVKPNDPYGRRTAPLASKRYILYIYSTNIRTEYFKHGIYKIKKNEMGWACGAYG
jgi:hypothetical protein